MNTPETLSPATAGKAEVVAQQATPTTIKGWLQSESFKEQIAKALPSVCKPDRFMRVALTALMKTPKLQDCSMPSVLKCFLDCASLGIEPDGRRAHLIPYGKECTLIVDYKGLIEIIRRSGDVLKIHAASVCENDVFEHDCGVIKKHVIDWKKPRGSAYAYYATATLKGGVEQCEVMSIDEVSSIRKRSRAGNAGPWVTDFDEMAKKTVFRRLSKWLPFSAELRMAEEIEDEHDSVAAVREKFVPTDSNPFNLEATEPLTATVATEEGGAQ